MKENDKIELFEKAPISGAVAKLAVPMIFSSLVMVLYNMADTYFVGMMNDPVENAAVSLAAPVLLAFNAVNNLFGVGTSSMMSRALGRKDYETVSESSAFGFYCSLICGVIFGLLCGLLHTPLLTLIGADTTTRAATQGYMFWTVYLGGGAGHPQCSYGISGAVRGSGSTRQHRNDERMSAQYCSGSCIYTSVGTEHGSCRSRTGNIPV